MKIGLIADVHGNAPALEVVLAMLANTVDRVLFLGDLTGYYAFVNECASMLDGSSVLGVLGNHDEIMCRCIQNGSSEPPGYRIRYVSALERSRSCLSEQARALLTTWPTQRQLTLGSVSVAMYHGTPWNPLNGRVYPDFQEWERFDHCPADVILISHTHYSLIKRWKNKLIVNPGSVGQPRDRSGKAAYAILDLLSGEVSEARVGFDANRVIQDSQIHDPKLRYLVEVLTR
jgi:putative phosphoesterase